MKLDYDVIVIGAGPGGTTAARCCAEAGFKTLLVEKERLPRYKTCGGCLSPKTVSLLPFNLDSIVENTIFAAKFTYRVKDPFILKTETPMAFMVMRDRFDQFLIEKSLEQGVDLIEGNKVLQAEEKGTGIEIELKNGEKIHCQYLIGADGPESLTARSFALIPPKGREGGLRLKARFPSNPYWIFRGTSIPPSISTSVGFPMGMDGFSRRETVYPLASGVCFKKGREKTPGRIITSSPKSFRTLNREEGTLF